MARFEDLILVLRNLTTRTLTPGVSVAGILSVDTPEMLAALHACEKSVENTALTLTTPDDIALVTIGSKVELEIRVPRPGFGFIFKDLDAMLLSPIAHVKEPANFFLLDTDYCSRDPAPVDHIITVYRKVLEFIGMLKTCAAFLDEREQLLIFIKEGKKFEVPVSFTEADLQILNLDTLSGLIGAIPDGIHQEQCASIMAESVYELTAMLPSSKRFVVLLNHVDDLKERFEKGYKLFAAGFSYEKIRDEIEAARIEYSGKIHKVFSDIQNQLLGIPVATIIVATQMKESSKVDGNFWTSTAVLLGSLVFTILMHFLLRNQRQTLEVIGIEIKRQKDKLAKEHAAIATNFEDTFKSLDTRYAGQRRILYAVDGVVSFGFALALFFFYSLSLPIQLLVALLLGK
jgi:hypothetical protein